MKKTIINTLLGLTLSSSLFAVTAEEIVKKHAEATAIELEAYLKENPDATDKDSAEKILLSSYRTTGDTEKSTVIYQRQFDVLGTEGTPTTARALHGATRNLFSIYLEQGKKEQATALIASAITKAASTELEARLIDSFNLMKGQFNTPKIGDSMDMKFTSLRGKEIDLAAMKGKVVLVDFWATWCGPCVKELPHLKKAYQEYNDKGFEIISVSVDKEADREKLQNFIKNKEMTWPQHYDGKGSVNEFAVKYGVNSYPTTFLVGQNGKVIATNLRGIQLEQALTKAFSEAPAESKTN